VKIVAQGTDRGGVFNEDALGVSADAAWVIDGATSLGPSRMAGTSDAAWFAHEVSRQLGDISGGASGGVRDRLARAIAAARAIYEGAGPLPAEPWAMPSAGAALLRRDGDVLEIATLGDVKVWLIGPEGAVTLMRGGDVLEALDAQALSALREIRAGQGDIALKAARVQLDPLLRENRAKMNREGGYWVLSLDPACLDGMEVLRVPVTQVRQVLMATDGFYDLWGVYGAPFAQVLDGLTKGQGAYWLDRLRTIERADPEGLLYPRFKTHDDASWLLVEV